MSAFIKLRDAVKGNIRNARDVASSLYALVGARLTVFLQTEPVRARSYVAAALVAASTVIPGLASHKVDEILSGVLVSAATVAAGESARGKVSPVDEK